MAQFKTKIPFVTRVGKSEPGATLGPFVDYQIGPNEFRDQFISRLKDTNPVFPIKQYSKFEPDGEDLTLEPFSGKLIPNTGKDPFSISGQGYLKSFIANYDKSGVISPENKVNAGGLISMIQQDAQPPQRFPGSEGTAIS